MSGLSETLAHIVRMDQAELNATIDAIKARHRVLRAEATAEAVASFNVGDKVSLTGIKPKYLDGLSGVIEWREGDKFRVDLGRPHGRYSQFVTVPASCLVRG